MNKALKATAVLALCAFLSACSAMQGIGSAVGALGSDAPSVDATAQVGKENKQEGDAVVDNRRVTSSQKETSTDSETEVSDNKGETHVSSSSDTVDVSQSDSTDGVSSKDWTADSINVSQIPTSFLVLFALGWMLPGAATVYKGIGKGLVFLKNKVFGEGG